MVAQRQVPVTLAGDLEDRIRDASVRDRIVYIVNMHGQIVASMLNTTVDHVRVRQSDTDYVTHDTGAFGSTGTVVAGSATREAAEALAGEILDFVASITGVAREDCALDARSVRCGDRLMALEDIAAEAESRGVVLSGVGHSHGTPRSVP